MTAHTLMLDSDWDITLDSAGGISITAGDYAIAQNVANAIRLFTNDAFYDADKGIPHFDIELGQKPTFSVLRARIREAALNVDGVSDAVPELDYDDEKRIVTGQVLLTLDSGKTANIKI